ncbi:MAG TPA: hypothetical protein VMM15_08205 [Bradyrhizobium sp.]|nr:hypothetical protein [Bradyrhizobium sp.]
MQGLVELLAGVAQCATELPTTPEAISTALPPMVSFAELLTWTAP